MGEHLKTAVGENHAIIDRLARVSEIRFVDADLRRPRQALHAADFDVAVVYERKIDVAAECEKLNKEIAKQEKNVANADRQLGNPSLHRQGPASHRRRPEEAARRSAAPARQAAERPRFSRLLSELEEWPASAEPALQHFPVLGIADPPRSKAAIHKAYRTAAKLWHPDRYENNQRKRLEAEEQFKRIQVAYRELCEHFDNPQRRLC